MFFDTHAHYDDKGFDNDRDLVLKKAYEGGVKYILSASTDIASSVENISLTQKYDFIYTAVGIHPHNVLDINNQIISALADFASYPGVVAIGEIGLDYYYDNAPREIQKMWFSKQLSLAVNLKKPVIVHDREAHEDTMDIIKSENARNVGGVFHCYSGSVEMAREVLNQNFYISIAGAITFKNVKRLQEVVKYIPEDRLLIETDSPYLTPEPFRGKRNDSSYIHLIAERIAAIKGKSVREIAEITTLNARKLFNIN